MDASERQLKDDAEIVIHDDPSVAGRQLYYPFARRYLPGASCRLLGDLLEPGEIKAILVEKKLSGLA